MRAAIVAAWLVLIATRTWLAARLDLMADEAFYWMCSQRLDVGYSDHPPMTAMLVRLGTTLGGPTSLGVRWPFGLCGALLPAVVWALARRVSGPRTAWVATGLCLAMPLLQMTFTLATPDAPLLLFGAAMLLFVARATDGGRTADWAAAGACAGLGMATHYRFALFPFSIALWMLLTSAGRRCLRTRGAWWAAALALAGCLPALLFNVREHFAPLTYQLFDRHGSPIGPRAWLNQLVEQGVAVTPVLYVAMLVALADAWRRMRRGTAAPGFGVLAFAAWTTLAVYFIASPLSDQEHDHVHWPQLGYLPLLVLVPDVLRRWWEGGRLARTAAMLAPALAGLLLVGVVADMASGVLGWIPQRPFLGWNELSHYALAHRADGPDGPPLLVADNYITAAQLDFHAGGTVDVFTLDHPKNARHGRALQFGLWGLDEAGLAAHAGRDALVVLDRGATGGRVTAEWEEHVRSLFERTERVGRVLAHGQGFTLWRGLGVRASATAAPSAPP